MPNHKEKKKKISIFGRVNNQGAVKSRPWKRTVYIEGCSRQDKDLSLTTPEGSSSMPGLEQMSEANLAEAKFTKVKEGKFFLKC